MKRILGIFLCFICLIGCGSKKESAPEPSNQNKSSESEPTQESLKLKIVDTSSKSRPYAVMINNHPSARKNHAGLQDAYIVYEMIVEGGMTRYMALFKDQETAKIGSVRSSRHYYLDYALENDAIYTHWGFSTEAENDIKTLKINNINGLTYEGVYFFRDKNLNVAYEHTGFTKMEMLKKATEKLKYRTETNKDLLLNYSADEIDLSTKNDTKIANNVKIVYSSSMNTSYVYDKENKIYKRYVNGAVHKDGVTGKQYTTKNIITYQVKNTSIDTYGKQTLDNIGTGTGYYITDGYAVPITWEKKSRESQTIYKYSDGKEIDVNDGNTYIQIQPKNQKLTISK